MSRATSRLYKLNVVQRCCRQQRAEELTIPLRYVTLHSIRENSTATCNSDRERRQLAVRIRIKLEQIVRALIAFLSISCELSSVRKKTSLSVGSVANFFVVVTFLQPSE